MNNIRKAIAVLLCSAGLSTAVQAADVAAIGDSMMKAVGRAIRKEYGAGNATVEVFTSIGSGLARLDLLDWHAKAAGIMAEHHPSTVFIMMGANDNQAMQAGNGVLAFGTPGWNSEYGRRAGRLMDILLQGGAQRVVWIGMPGMREPKLEAEVRVMEQVILQEVETRKQVTYFHTTGRLSPKSEYKAYIILDSGMPLDVRSEDGIHLNRNGAEYLAALLLKTFPAK